MQSYEKWLNSVIAEWPLIRQGGGDKGMAPLEEGVVGGIPLRRHCLGVLIAGGETTMRTGAHT